MSNALAARPCIHPLATAVAMALGLVTQQAAAAPTFETDAQELMYFWGTTFGAQVQRARITDPAEIEWIIRGLKDQAAGTAPAFREEYPSLLNNHLVKRDREATAAETTAASDYVRKMGQEAGATTTESGLVYREIAAGQGDQPTKESKVTVHYVGTLRDGTVFDSSRERGLAFETRLTSVIPCWSEAIPMMKVGGKARITCPPGLAYGDRGTSRIPGGAALTFDVELLEVAR